MRHLEVWRAHNLSSEQIYLNDQDKVCSPENATQMIQYTFDNDVLVGVERFYPDNNSIQESNPNHEPAGNSKGGQFAKGSGGGGQSDSENAKDIRIKTREYKKKYDQYKQYDPQWDAAKGERNTHIHEPVDLSPQPTLTHYATAYALLKKRPDLDEQATIKNAWLADIEIDAHNKTMPIVKRNMQTALDKTLPTATVVSRVKTRYGIIEKMAKKPKYKQPSDLGDISGYRVVGENDVETAIANEILHGVVSMDPAKSEDTREKPKDGYRAIHEEMILPDGRRAELQLKTPNQQTWSDYAHDHTYKIDESTEVGKLIKANLPIFKGYNSAMSDYFYELDTGKNPKNRPKCPEIVLRSIGCL